jgi:hypothetical protein
MLLELESRDDIAPNVVRGLSGFHPKFDINTKRIPEEEAGPTDPELETTMGFLTALFLLNSSSGLSTSRIPEDSPKQNGQCDQGFDFDLRTSP